MDDLIIGAPRADNNGSYSGSSYVVFGTNAGVAATLNVSTLNGTNGFRIDGAAGSDRSGTSVSSAGDVNGDGFDDLIIGAYFADPNGTSSGASYVVFGKATAFSPTFNLSTLDGTNGFRISGVVASDYSGFSVSDAGDVNGDGFADLIIGARKADPNGFRINGVATGDYSGNSVSAAGDVNGDGFDDVIIGALYADPVGTSSGTSYIVFG